MKKMFTLIALATAFVVSACNKEAPAASPPISTPMDQTKITMDAIVDTDIAFRYLNESEFVLVYDSALCNIPAVPKEIWHKLLTADAASISIEDKYQLLMRYLPSTNIRETDGYSETIIRKPTGNPNVNGGQSYWDATSEQLAEVVSRLNTPVEVASHINYLNSGSSATSITMGDVLRAANGYYNTSFDSILEINDVVFELPISGDGNFLVGAVVSFQGSEYLFSNFEIDGFPNLGPLVYDPIDGQGYFVGPFPGGIASVSGEGWSPPLIE